MPELTITNMSLAVVAAVVAPSCLYLLYRGAKSVLRASARITRKLVDAVRHRGQADSPATTITGPVLWDAPLAIGVAMPLNSHSPAEEAGEDAKTPAPEPINGRSGLSRSVKWLIGLASVIGVALLLYGFSGSYTTLFDLATAHGVPLPELNPVGVDLGLVGVVLMDIVLTLIRMPIAWLRQVARGLALGTIGLNAAAGWTATGPDFVAIAQHCYAPVMIVVIVEALRLTLLRKAKQASIYARDPIPIMRWILDPVRTPAMYRRMVLWGESSYPNAIDLEIERRQAIMALRVVYGGGAWKRKAPADLVWMIKSGVRITDALARVRDIVAAEPAAQQDMQAQSTGPAEPDMASAGSDTPTRHGAPDAGSDMGRSLRLVRDANQDAASDRTGANRSPGARDVFPDAGREQDSDTDTEAAALEILAAEPDISGAELGRRLGKTERHGSRLKRALTGAIHTEATGE